MLVVSGGRTKSDFRHREFGSNFWSGGLNKIDGDDPFSLLPAVRLIGLCLSGRIR